MNELEMDFILCIIYFNWKSFWMKIFNNANTHTTLTYSVSFPSLLLFYYFFFTYITFIYILSHGFRILRCFCSLMPNKAAHKLIFKSIWMASLKLYECWYEDVIIYISITESELHFNVRIILRFSWPITFFFFLIVFIFMKWNM